MVSTCSSACVPAHFNAQTSQCAELITNSSVLDALLRTKACHCHFAFEREFTHFSWCQSECKSKSRRPPVVTDLLTKRLFYQFLEEGCEPESHTRLVSYRVVNTLHLDFSQSARPIDTPGNKFCLFWGPFNKEMHCMGRTHSFQLLNVLVAWSSCWSLEGCRSFVSCKKIKC